jgi:hypothetical protein
MRLVGLSLPSWSAALRLDSEVSQPSRYNGCGCNERYSIIGAMVVRALVVGAAPSPSARGSEAEFTLAELKADLFLAFLGAVKLPNAKLS